MNLGGVLARKADAFGYPFQLTHFSLPISGPLKRGGGRAGSSKVVCTGPDPGLGNKNYHVLMHGSRNASKNHVGFFCPALLQSGPDQVALHAQPTPRRDYYYSYSYYYYYY